MALQSPCQKFNGRPGRENDETSLAPGDLDAKRQHPLVAPPTHLPLLGISLNLSVGPMFDERVEPLRPSSHFHNSSRQPTLATNLARRPPWRRDYLKSCPFKDSILFSRPEAKTREGPEAPPFRGPNPEPVIKTGVPTKPLMDIPWPEKGVPTNL